MENRVGEQDQCRKAKGMDINPNATPLCPTQTHNRNVLHHPRATPEAIKLTLQPHYQPHNGEKHNFKEVKNKNKHNWSWIFYF